MPVNGKCGLCSKEARKSCAKCRLMVYCGKECQRQHWKTHKKTCGQLLKTSSVAPIGNGKVGIVTPNSLNVKPDAQILFHLMQFTDGIPDEMDGLVLAFHYQKFPMIPYGTSITVHGIGALNYDVLNRKEFGGPRGVKYKHFRKQWPDIYEEGKNPKEDYMDEEQVSPAFVKFSTAENPNDIQKARIKYAHW